MRLVQFFETD